ncbi:hypothetical protein H107_01333 [Trichophyton rubrum CBS 202.88]|nr:hypothetical protein H107_01333 [Trichophyton rubrum CBS 202.88]
MLKFGHTQALASAGGESLKGPKGVENPANEAPFGMRQMFQAIACGLVQHAGSLREVSKKARKKGWNPDADRRTDHVDFGRGISEWEQSPERKSKRRHPWTESGAYLR